MANKIPKATQESGLSDTEYFWVILFNWSEDNPKPFEIYVCEIFSETDIPSSWFQRKLTQSKRHQKARLSPFGENIFSVFGKIEKGKLALLEIKKNKINYGKIKTTLN